MGSLFSLDILKMQIAVFCLRNSSVLNIANVYHQDVFRRLEASSEIVSLLYHIFVLKVENLTLIHLIGNYAK